MGCFFAAAAALTIRVIAITGKVHYMLVPFGWVLGHLILSPLSVFSKVLLTPED